MEDDVSQATMLVIDESDGGGSNPSSFWIADDAGLGVLYRVVTNTGDHLVWSS